jgi:cob(I)alamin adenosyltransferase
MSPDSIITQQGDNGVTSLIGHDRIFKSDLRPEAFGSCDEASALLGLVRSKMTDHETANSLLTIQTHIYLINAELACPDDKRHLLSRFLGAAEVAWLTSLAQQLSNRVTLPSRFVLYGETEGSAWLDFGRAVIRRAERAVIALHRREPLVNEQILAYLNRLSDYIFLLARMVEIEQGAAFRVVE